MTREQEAKLETLGVHWRMQADRAWERGYAAALRYRKTHADLLPNVFYHDPEGFPLGEWLTYHRQRRANGEMPTERIAGWKPSAWCGIRGLHSGRNTTPPPSNIIWSTGIWRCPSSTSRLRGWRWAPGWAASGEPTSGAR